MFLEFKVNLLNLIVLIQQIWRPLIIWPIRVVFCFWVYWYHVINYFLILLLKYFVFFLYVIDSAFQIVVCLLQSCDFLLKETVLALEHGQFCCLLFFGKGQICYFGIELPNISFFFAFLLQVLIYLFLEFLLFFLQAWKIVFESDVHFLTLFSLCFGLHFQL